ncbi:Molybdopterin-synthase adenylyltransferase [Methanolapillus ohkumae]|uniref:Molybdopterin-synthase adenylyltransferase n=2 Tax=Methanolapillus ohkumae TaxID=3028298 RepID=A0AA96VHQ0_9EURY|nr:Molybdopterin-synthase adenylyltransferase [Methanosarcinaceae archaeon Am2]
MAVISKKYFRQNSLLSDAGQQALQNSRVFIAGAGGLGSPVATYLVAAGVGQITLLDFDAVDATNLNRQFLHHEKDIGKNKAFSGKEKLSSQNPDILILPVTEKLTANNVADLVNNSEIIVDALDNDETRQILAKFAHDRKIPYFHAAVYGFSGQVSVFLPGGGPCFFCAFPESELLPEPLLESSLKSVSDSDSGSNIDSGSNFNSGSNSKCETAEKFPIVGSVCGVVGSMEANEVIKYITQKGELATGKLLIWDGLINSLDILEIPKEENCPVCGKNLE